jgi:hypothetical protein
LKKAAAFKPTDGLAFAAPAVWRFPADGERYSTGSAFRVFHGYQTRRRILTRDNQKGKRAKRRFSGACETPGTASLSLTLLAAVAALAWVPAALAQTRTNLDIAGNPPNWGGDPSDHLLGVSDDPFGSGIGSLTGTIWYKINQTPVTSEAHVTIIGRTTPMVLNNSIVAGGQKSASGAVSGNSIIFSNSRPVTFNGSAYAGASLFGSDYTDTVTVSGNALTFDGQVTASVEGKAGAGAALWGDVTGNTVTIELEDEGRIQVGRGGVTGRQAGGIWAGIALAGGNVKNNAVVIKGDKTIYLSTQNIVGGATAGKGTTAGYKISKNSVVMEKSENQTREITVTVGIAGAVVNGQDDPDKTAHEITENTVEIYSEGVRTINIYGGQAVEDLNGATFKENSVRAEANVTVADRLAGAYSDGSSGENTFTGNGVDVAGSVTGMGPNFYNIIYGAYGYSGTATGNYVKLTVKAVNGAAAKDSGIQGDVAGAWLSGDSTGDFSGNHVLLDGMADGAGKAIKIGGSVYGGYIGGEAGTAKRNYVFLTGNVQISNSVYGAYTNGGDAGGDGFSDGNKVVIGRLAGGGEKPFTGTVGEVSGAYVVRETSGDAMAANNSVEIIGSEIVGSNGDPAFVSGGTVIGKTPGTKLENGTACQNSVSIRDGSRTGIVAGGTVSTAEKSATAADNHVSVIGSKADELYGGYIIYAATPPLWAKADNNEVEVENSTVGRTYGGYVRDFSGAGAAISGSASGNTLKFTGATLKGSVYGGYIEGDSSSSALATGNTVTFIGATMLDAASVDVVGGFTPGAGDRWTGNTLEFDRFTHADGNPFKSISGFSALKFMIHDTFDPAGGSPIVRTETLDLTAGSSGNASVRQIDKAGGGYLTEGDEIILIRSEKPIAVNGDFEHEPVTGWQLSTSYVFQVEVDNDDYGNNHVLKATLTSQKPNEQVKAISELPLADVSFVNVGAEVLANDAIKSAAANALKAGGVGAFAALGYSKYRVETGSHIDVKGINGNIGVAVSGETSAGIGTAGLFLEFGRGEFDSYNDFQGLPSVHGSGDVSYIGGGILGRMEFGSAGASRPYAEGSVRFGRTSTDFDTGDFLANFEGGLELHSGYYGFHFGLGYVLSIPALGDDGSLDFSAKLFHTRRDGGDFIALGERIAVSAVTSTKLIVGGRLNIGLSENVRPFVGAYYEREFKGESRVTVGRFALPAASLKGETGIGELGVSFASPSVPLKVELGLQGSCGKRDGVAVSLMLNYAF